MSNSAKADVWHKKQKKNPTARMCAFCKGSAAVTKKSGLFRLAKCKAGQKAPSPQISISVRCFATDTGKPQFFLRQGEARVGVRWYC